MKINFKGLKVIDWVLLIIPLILVILGISIIYSLTYYSNINLFYNQIIFAVIGLVLMIVFTIIDYRQLKASSFNLYLIGIGLLILVLLFGKESFGSTRWFDLGFFDLQPSELFKLFLIVYLASYLSDKIGKITFKNIIAVFVIGLIPVGLVLMEPDLGTSILLILILLSMLFACKLKFKQIISFILIFALSVPLAWSVMQDYQKQRIMTFVNPSNDPYGAGYNVTQSIITVGSGGLFGKGFGQGPQSQLNFLPVAHTDFVFAGISEAIGFIGTSVLLIIIAVLIIRILSVAKISKDNFGSLVAIGIATVVFFQTIVNIGMNIGLMPVTGMTLPFISYGGSSLLMMLIFIGILQSIYMRHKKISFK